MGFLDNFDTANLPMGLSPFDLSGGNLGNASALGFAAGMLSQGPSRLPVTFAQSVGAGLQGLQQARKDYLSNAVDAAKVPYIQAQTKQSEAQSQLVRAQIAAYLADANDKPPSIYVPGGAAGGQTPPTAPQGQGGPNAAILGTNAPIGDDFVDRIIANESRSDPNAQNPRSSAGGAGQFLDKTWMNVARSHFPGMVGNMGDGDLLALKADPGFSRQMVSAYAQDNAKVLSGAGIPVNGATLYAAHFLGPQGAVKVLSADPTTPLPNLLSQEVIAANPSLANQTAGRFAANMSLKMAGGQRPVRMAQAQPQMMTDATSAMPAAQPGLDPRDPNNLPGVPVNGGGPSYAGSSAVPPDNGGPIKTNAIGEKYQFNPTSGEWTLLSGLPTEQAIAAARALRPGSPGYAATRGPGNDVGIDIDPSTGRPLVNPTPSAAASAPNTAAVTGDGQPFAPHPVSAVSPETAATYQRNASLYNPPGTVQMQPPPGATINPAAIEWAQRKAQRDALLGRTTPAHIAELAKLPLVGPTAQATAAGTAAGQYPTQVALKNLESNNTIKAELAKSGMQMVNGQIVPITGFTDVTQANARAKAQGEQGPKVNEIRPGTMAATGDQIAQAGGAITNTGEAGERGKKLADIGTLYRDEANAARSQQFLVGRMMTTVNGFSPGYGADEAATVKSVINGIFPDAFKDSLPSYQEFQKYAIQNAREQTRSMGAGEAASVFQTNIQANPNAAITLPALKSLLGGMAAINDYKVARDDAAAEWRGLHNGSMEGFDNSAWMKQNPIMKFKLPYMSTEELKTLQQGHPDYQRQ